MRTHTLPKGTTMLTSVKNTALKAASYPLVVTTK
jgi:hypothetical protein